MKKIIFYSVILILIFIGIFLLSQYDSTPPKETAPSTDFPSNTITSPYPNSSSVVALKSGGDLLVKDFLKQPNTVVVDDITYQIAESKDLSNDVQYQIFYFSGDKSIVISIQDENVALVRKMAEAEIRALLGVTDEQICSLDIRVTLPSFVDSDLAGKNLGLSFCPGNVNI